MQTPRDVTRTATLELKQPVRFPHVKYFVIGDVVFRCDLVEKVKEMTDRDRDGVLVQYRLHHALHVILKNALRVT